MAKNEDERCGVSPFSFPLILFPESPNGMPLPPHLVKRFTPSRLLKKGFQKKGRSQYFKWFSGILKLKVTILGAGDKLVEWDLDIDAFEKMLKDLEKIDTDLQREALTVYRGKRGKRAGKPPKLEIYIHEGRKGEEYPPRGTRSLVGSAYMEASQRIAEKKRAYEEKYRDFLSIAIGAMEVFPGFRTLPFGFDACHTTSQMKPLLKFVKFYISVFVCPCWADSERRIPSGKIENALAVYYIFMKVIKELRALWKRDSQKMSFDDWKLKFPMITDQLLSRITEDATEKRGWEHTRWLLALAEAARMCGIKPGHLKQIMNEDREFLAAVRRDINSLELDDILEFLGDKDVYPHAFLYLCGTTLARGKPRKVERIALIRRRLSVVLPSVR